MRGILVNLRTRPVARHPRTCDGWNRNKRRVAGLQRRQYAARTRSEAANRSEILTPIYRRSLVRTFGIALLLAAVASGAQAEECPIGDLVRVGDASLIGGRGSLPQLIDESGPNEGSAWNHPDAVQVDEHDTQIRVDLAGQRLLRGLALQADGNDRYAVDASTDARQWSRVWLAAPVPGAGLRSRSVTLEEPVRARYLRVRVVDSDGAASVSGIAAFCRLPAEWPLGVHAGTHPSPWMTQARIDAIKFAVALAATALFGWGVALRRAGRAETDRKPREALLASLAVIAGLCWWNLFSFHFDSPVHTWEQFHYYVGSKYQKELGYERLYACATVADAEDGAVSAESEPRIRDLISNRIVSAGAALEHPEACTSHFSPERWSEFKHDIGWFREALGSGRWAEAKRDHGYNGTPVWGIAGGWIANTIPPTNPGILLIASLDSLLLVLMWTAAAWVFGWRGACVALLWWGTNYLGRFWWVGGGFLRQDWLVLCVLGIACVKQQRHALGGAALAAATLLRIFPAFLILALLLKWAVGCARARSLALPREALRFVAGGIACSAVLVGISFATAGGPSAWVAFAENSQLHLGTPLTNNVGLEPLLSVDSSTRARLLFDPEADDAFAAWKEAKLRVFEQREWLAALVLLGFLALLARAVEQSEDWVALVLGVGLIPFAVSLSGYYYTALLVYGFLWERGGERAAMLLCALAAATCLLGYTSDWYDEVFAAQSLAMLLFIVAITAWWPALSREPAPS